MICVVTRYYLDKAGRARVTVQFPVSGGFARDLVHKLTTSCSP